MSRTLTLLREHSDADHPTVEFVVTVGEESGWSVRSTSM